MAVIQIRIDKKLKEEAINLLNDYDLDLSTAIRMFLLISVIEKKFPFDLTINEKNLKHLHELNRIWEDSKANGLDKMTMEEIEEEIRLSRLDRKK